MESAGPVVLKVEGGTLESQLHVEIFNDHVLKTRGHCGMDPDTFIIQQDNASVHTGRVVTKRFEIAMVMIHNLTNITLGTRRERVQGIWEDLLEDFLPNLYRGACPTALLKVVGRRGREATPVIEKYKINSRISLDVYFFYHNKVIQRGD